MIKEIEKDIEDILKESNIEWNTKKDYGDKYLNYSLLKPLSYGFSERMVANVELIRDGKEITVKLNTDLIYAYGVNGDNDIKKALIDLKANYKSIWEGLNENTKKEYIKGKNEIQKHTY